MAIGACGDLGASTAIVAEQMTARLGRGPVTATMTAHVIEARQPEQDRSSRHLHRTGKRAANERGDLAERLRTSKRGGSR